MKLLNKLYLRIIFSIVIGGFLASGFTKFQQPCTGVAPPGEDITRCIEISKVFMHPEKIFSDSKVRGEFAKNFAVVSVISFGLISVVYYRKKLN